MQPVGVSCELLLFWSTAFFGLDDRYDSIPRNGELDIRYSVFARFLQANAHLTPRDSTSEGMNEGLQQSRDRRQSIAECKRESVLASTQ